MQQTSNLSNTTIDTSEQLFISHQELAEILVKKNDIHEGIWSVIIEFQMGAAIAGQPDNVLPSGIIGVSRVGIQRAPALNNLSVDAAVVNPPVKKVAKATKRIIKK